jgi:hypothetical protein
MIAPLFHNIFAKLFFQTLVHSRDSLASSENDNFRELILTVFKPKASQASMVSDAINGEAVRFPNRICQTFPASKLVRSFYI